MTGVHCSCCSGAHNYPVEVAEDAATWQTVISAFSTPMLWFLSPHTHSRGPHFMLCSLPPRTAPHGASTSRRCTPYKRWVSLPKLDSRADPYHAGLCTDFHFVPLKLARWQLGWSARAAPCLQGPWGSAWIVAVGALLYWLLLLQKEIPPCLLPSPQRWYLPAAFQTAFLSYLFHPCEGSSMTSCAMRPSMYWSHTPYTWGKPQGTISCKLLDN